MGRKQFLAARVAQAAERSMAIPRTPRTAFNPPPPWLKVVEAIPPTQVLIRTVPTAHHPPNPRMRKPRRTYRPQHIMYEEDKLRQTFFKDHPWELARPRVLVESDGKDAQLYDWSKGLYQPGMPLCGECVVQRQLWLMQNGGMTVEQAYDSARREFYRLRHQEEVERRVAVEEARMVGAYFGKSALQAGMDVEDFTYERWKAWAAQETEKIEAERGQAFAFSAGPAAEGEAASGESANATA